MNITGLMKVPEIAGPIQELGAALGRRVVDADLYVAPPGCGSYGWHTDTVDVLVYLLLGSKRCRVAGRRPQSEVLVDASMSPGASVYIPAGAFHHGRPNSLPIIPPCLHTMPGSTFITSALFAPLPLPSIAHGLL